MSSITLSSFGITEYFYVFLVWSKIILFYKGDISKEIQGLQQMQGSKKYGD